MTQCVVCDIDGTIFENTHTNGSNMSWETNVLTGNIRFKPVVPMRSLLQAVAGTLYVVYATARRETLRSITVDLLAKNAFPMGLLYMNPTNGTLPSDVVKLRYLKQMKEAGWQPVVWFEDDDKVIEALRGQGICAIKCG